MFTSSDVANSPTLPPDILDLIAALMLTVLRAVTLKFSHSISRSPLIHTLPEPVSTLSVQSSLILVCWLPVTLLNSRPSVELYVSPNDLTKIVPFGSI